MPAILFVCTGNTCRSSMAEGLAKKIAREKGWTGEIWSAGVAAWPGAPATDEAIRAAAEWEVDISQHRARPLDAELVDKADLILTMAEHHKRQILDRFPRAAGKVFTLAEYAASEEGDIPDPIGYPLEAYRACAARLKELIEKALDRLGDNP
ncbi:MAG: low molecular weight protein arginine phosphatase [Thermoanaerobacteraceae bacterium]|nr:low molecular weight protein arginine phosphatase [Thermoanaerobacteraceae bacterium]